MDSKSHKSELFNFKRIALISACASLVLAFALVVALFMVKSSSGPGSAVIVPMDLTTPLEISTKNKHKDSYRLALAERIVQLPTTFNPENVSTRFERFLIMVHPAASQEMHTVLRQKEKEIIKNRISRAFHVTEMVSKNNTVVVLGEIQTFIGREFVPPKRTAIRITFRKAPDGIVNISEFVYVEPKAQDLFSKSSVIGGIDYNN